MWCIKVSKARALCKSSMEFDLQTNTQIRSFRRKRFIFCGVLAFVAVFFVGFAIGFVAFKCKETIQTKSKVKSPGHRVEDEEFQDRFLATVDGERIGESLRYVSLQNFKIVSLRLFKE